VATTTTIYADADANLREGTPDTNYSASVLRCGQVTGNRRHGVFHFDVSSFTAPSDITQASLTLTNSGSTGGNTRTMKIARLNQDFVEAEATWNSSATGITWTGGAGAEGNAEFTQPTYDITVGDVAGAQTVDIKALVIDAINRRDGDLWLVLCFDPADTAATPTGYSVIYSSENATPSNRPKIAVTVADRITWTGINDGNIDSYRNWSGFVVPTSDDYALFSSGNVDATTSVAGLSCNTLFVGKNYRGSIGSTSGYIKVLTNRAHFGSPHSDIHIEFNPLVSTVADVRISNTSPRSGSFRLNGKYAPIIKRTRHDISLATEDVTTIEAHSGMVVFTCDDDVTSLNITDATATMEDIPTNVTVAGRGYAILSQDDGSNTAITVAGTGRVKCLSPSTGHITLYSGTRITFMGNEGAPIETEEVYVYRNAILDTRTGAPTWTTDAEIFPRGGRVLFDGSRSVIVT